jgi:hypothetical protein
VRVLLRLEGFRRSIPGWIYDPEALPYKGFCMACVVCKSERDLKESHILSKFIYRPLKRVNGRMYLLTDDPSQKNRELQDGIKQYLLCGDCEAKRNKWETYFSNKWHRGELFGKSDPYTIDGLDYASFKLFLMSLLFMGSVSHDPLFKDIRLTPSSFEKLRRMVDAGDPGETDDFGCSIRMLEEEDIDLKMLVGKAETLRVDAVPIHRFLFGGFSLGFVDLEAISIADDVKKTFITKEGSIVIRKRTLRDLGYLSPTLKNLKKQGKLDGDP